MCFFFLYNEVESLCLGGGLEGRNFVLGFQECPETRTLSRDVSKRTTTAIAGSCLGFLGHVCQKSQQLFLIPSVDDCCLLLQLSGDASQILYF